MLNKYIKLNKCIKIALICSVLCLPAYAAAETKIGFVNVASVLAVAPQAKKSKEILQKEFSGRDKKLVAAQKKIVAAEQKYQKNMAVLSEAQRSKKERNILTLKRNFKRLKDEFEEDLSLRRNEELHQLQLTVAKTIDKVAKKKKYDLIFNEGVIFASKKVDISLQILKELKRLAKKKK